MKKRAGKAMGWINICWCTEGTVTSCSFQRGHVFSSGANVSCSR